MIEIVHDFISAKRELESGIGETPVMCQTSQSRHIDNDIELCKWVDKYSDNDNNNNNN